MAVIRFSSNLANNVLMDGTSSGVVTGTIAKTGSGSTYADSVILGGAPSVTQPISYIYIFSNSMPTDFSSFSSIDSRISDLLAVLPLRIVENTTPIGSNAAKVLGARFQIGQNRGDNTSGSVTRTNNVSTFTRSLGSDFGGIVVGQKFTLTSSNTAGNFTVSAKANSSSISFSDPGANFTSTSANLIFPYQPFANGTATWFCMARTPANFFSNTSLTTAVGAMIGNIGVTGSGADLQLANTTLSTNDYIISAGLTLNFPYDWTI
jgi:hypothetical protein